jgi:hypothetical protein
MITERKKETMTTESLLTKPGRAVRVAPSVLTGIGAFAAVGVYVLVSSVGLGLWTSLGPGPGLFPFAMGGVAGGDVSSLADPGVAPAEREG